MKGKAFIIACLAMAVTIAVMLAACLAPVVEKGASEPVDAQQTEPPKSLVGALEDSADSLSEDVLLPDGVGAAEYGDLVDKIDNYEAGETALGESYKIGRLGVWFSPDCGEARAREVVAGCRAVWLRGFAMHDGSIDVEVELPAGADELEAKERFESCPEVRFATLVVIDEISFEVMDDDLFAPRAGGIVEGLFEASDQQKYHLAAARFYDAWDDATCDGEVTVAVFDTGRPQGKVNDFGGSVDSAASYDAVNGWVGGGWVVDGDGHGTAVAGIISAEVGNGLGTDGASHGAIILPVKVAQGSGTTSSWDSTIRGLDYLRTLDKLPDVVNMSYGRWFGTSGISEAAADYDRYLVMQEMIGALRDDGVVFVSAAGNIDVLDPVDMPNYPAACEGVLSIGALAAPSSGDVGSILQGGGYPNAQRWQYSTTKSGTDLCAYGEGVWVLQPLPYDLPGFTLASESGTSVAAPQVAAAAALVKAKHSQWGAQDIEDALVKTAVKPLGMGGANRTDEYGYGALDAAAAVAWVPESGGAGGGGSPRTADGTDAGESDAVGSLGAAYSAQLVAQGRMADADDEEISAALADAMAANPDVFGWLSVPGTNVSLPLCRREGDDSYYLTHAADGTEASFGAAYVEAANSPSMGDSLTVAYGHTCWNAEVAFTQLHLFGYRPFFEAHDKVLVCLPGKVLEYRIAAASVLDDGHILGGVAAAGPGALTRLYAAVTDGSHGGSLVREGASVSAGDRVLMLSTCSNYGYKNRRFVVTCVLEGKREL